MALTAASLLPVLILVAVVVSYYAKGQRAAYEQQLLATARSLAGVVDQKTASIQSTLETLADSGQLRRNDLGQFYLRCKETAARLGGYIILSDRDHQLFNTSMDYDSKALPTSEWGRRGVEAGARMVSDLYVAQASGRYVTSVSIPVFQDGAPNLALSLTIDPAAFAALLEAQNYADGWRAAIVDRSGTVVARNANNSQFLGKPASSDFLAAVNTREEGVVTAKTLDALEVLSGFTRAEGGWVVVVGVDRRLLDAPLQISVLQILLGGALVTILTWVLGVWWSRRLSASTRALTLTAEALGRGEMTPVSEPMWYREADQLASALTRAGALLEQRERERDAATQKLREQVATMERRVEERTHDLITALSVANKASQAKSDFLASMSHELRTPLNAVIGFAQLLEAKLGKRREGDYAGYIHQAGEQLHVLINDILDLAKIESGQLKIVMEPTPLAPMFDQIETTMAPMAATMSVTLNTPPNDLSFDMSVVADAARLRQVLQNLVSNAIKYNRPGGDVTITVAPASPGRLRIIVSDTGTGIPLDRQDQLFQAFNRLGVEHSQIEGTGIGLTISRHLMDMMDGEIGFISEPGAGSQFWIELAMAESEADSAPPAAFADVATQRFANRSSLTILYVEDNATNRTLMVETMRAYPDYRLLTAESGMQGLAMATTLRPDVLLLDIRLPDMDGYDVLHHLRAAPETRAIPAIAVSAYALPSDIARGHEAGFVRYLTKPFLIEDLLSALEEATRHLRMETVVDIAAPAQYSRS